MKMNADIVRRTVFERDNGGAPVLQTPRSLPPSIVINLALHQRPTSLAPFSSDVVVAMDGAFVNPIGAKRKRTVIFAVAADATTERSADANTMQGRHVVSPRQSLPQEVIFSDATWT